jgi:hypothetical protein
MSDIPNSYCIFKQIVFEEDLAQDLTENIVLIAGNLSSQGSLGLLLTEFEEYPSICQSQEEEGYSEPYMEEWASMSEEEKQPYREEKAEEEW